MTQREIVVRICEAYIVSKQTIEMEEIMRLANYIIQHTSDCTPTYAWSSTYPTANVTTASDTVTYAYLNQDDTKRTDTTSDSSSVL